MPVLQSQQRRPGGGLKDVVGVLHGWLSDNEPADHNRFVIIKLCSNILRSLFFWRDNSRVLLTGREIFSRHFSCNNNSGYRRISGPPDDRRWSSMLLLEHDVCGQILRRDCCVDCYGVVRTTQKWSQWSFFAYHVVLGTRIVNHWKRSSFSLDVVTKRAALRQSVLPFRSWGLLT